MRDSSDIADKRQRDFDDLQHELTGRDVGRQRRFLSVEDDRSPEAARKKREREQTRRSLAMLLNDPIYRARHYQAMDALRSAEQAVAEAHRTLDALVDAAQVEIAAMEDTAARLPDGTLVFRDADGVVRQADGTKVDDDLTATILWTGHEPSFEDYIAAQTKLQDLQSSQTDVRRYETDVLGVARNRLTDEENPPSLEELDGIIQSIEAEMPAAVQQASARIDDPVAAPDKTTNVAIPNLGASF